MKKLITHSIKVLTLLAFLLSYTNANAQVGNFNITVENVTQTALNKLEFDVYLLDTDPGQSFELASCQLGFLINSDIYTGGTLTVTINNTGSGLNGAQQFTASPTVVATLTGFPNQSLIRLAAGSPVSPGGGTIISTTDPGTLMTHFIVTSSVNFTANTTPDLTFTSNTATAPLYATRVAEFIASISTLLPVNPGTNALVNGNPVLNPLVAPTAFTVTGGGSYCQGAGGLPVGLSDSEIGVTYTLIRNGIDQLPTVPGTGASISFGTNLIGTYTYTVRGTNGSGSTPMLNSVIITENPTVFVSVTISPSANNICAGTSVTFTPAPVGGGTTPTYQWFKNSVAVGTGVTYSYVPVNGDLVYVVMTSNATCASGSPATSNTIAMVVNSTVAASVSIVASANPVCSGTSVTFTPTPVGGGTTPTYQWFKNSVAVATGSTYTYVPVNGDAIRVVMTSNATCVTGSPATSNTITMVVNSTVAASVSIVASANPVCSGTSVTFTPTPVGGGTTPTYQWFKNSVAVATGSTYTYVPVNGDAIRVVMTSNATCVTGSPATSNTITMVVNSTVAASVSIVASANPVCSGTSVTFTPTPVGGGTTPTYQWFKNSVAVATGSTYTYVPVNGDAIRVVMTSNATCVTGSPATSNTITMVVNSTVAASVSIVASANPVCSGTSVTFTPTPVGGGTTPTYQWFKNSVAVATGSTYTYVPVNGDAVYVVMTSNSTCATGSPATSNTIAMVVNPTVAASVSIVASANPVCSGTSVTFTPTPVGGGTTPTYQWFKNSVAIATGSTYTYVPVNGDLVYVVMTSNATCVSGSPATSSTIAMVVNSTVAASVSIVASANPVCSGTSVTFTPTPVGGGTTPTYQWFKNSVAVATGSTYTYVPVNGDAIRVVMTSNATCVTGSPATSNTITMVVNSTVAASVSIVASANPVCSGTSVTFTPTPVGGGTTPTYQWFKNSVAVATGSTYTYVPVNGDAVYVIMTSNSTCATGNPATSNTITLTVNPIPSAPTIGIITQPTCLVATGSVILNGLPAGNWTINPGAIAGTGASTTISNLVAGTHVYTVTTAAGCTSLASANVVINVQPPTPIVNNQTATISSGGTFNITPSGATIPVGTTYTWPAPTYTGLVTGGVAQLTPLLSITGTLTNPSGTGTAIYTVTPVSGTCTGAVFTVTVTVNSTCVPVSITTQPGSSTVCAVTGSAPFTVVASGTGPFTYQWQYNSGTWGNVTNGVPAGAVYTNTTTATMTVTGITAAAAYQYRCFITNCSGGNTIFSNAATLTINALPVPTLTSSDANNIFCLGTSVTFTAGGGGAGATYDFRVNGATVQTGPSTTYTTTSLANAQVVTVVVTNANLCSATSAGIANFVNQPPYITSGPIATCSTDYLTYSVVLSVNTGTVTSTSGIVANTGGNNWSITGILAGVNITITITDINGCITTQPITAPNCLCPILTPPGSGGDRSYCAGGVIPTLSATVAAGGNPKTVDWYNSASGGTPLLSGSLTYTPTIAGTYYALTREIVSNCVSSTRTPIVLTMNPLPIATLTSSDADNIFCAGTSVIFTASGGTNYNFNVSGSPVQNGVSATYTTNSLTNGQAVNVIITNVNGCIATAGPITNTVNPTPTPTLTSSDADNTFCAGTSITFTAGGGTAFDFRIGGISVQNGALATYTTTTLTNGQIVNVVVSNANGCAATSPSITNTVNPTPIPTLTSSDADNIFCAGTSITFTASGGTNYNFRVGSVTAQNGASNTYITNSLTNGQVVTVIVGNSIGCTVTSVGITNTVNPQPTVNGGPGGNSCDLSFKLNAVPSIGTGTWSQTTGPGTATFAPNANTANATVTVSEYGTYTFTWTEISGTCSGSSVVTVNFYLQPVVNAGTGGNNCGLEFYLNASLNAGVGTWSMVSGPGNATFSPDANTANALVTVTAYGSYTFMWSVVNGICTNSGNVTVVFIQQPPANAGSGGSECDKDFILNALVPATGTGTWTKFSGPGNAVFTPNNHQSNATVTVDQFGTYEFAWTVVNSSCTSSDIVKVVFHDLPSINAGRDTVMCKGGSIQLHALGAGSVSWTPVALVSNPNILNPVAMPDATTTFIVNLTDQFGCKNSDGIVIEVREQPIADAGADQILGYLFESQMDAVVAHDYEKGVWSVISGTGEFSDSTYVKSDVTSLSSGENKFLWIVTNGFCLLSTDTVSITVNDFIIPTLITPNMDGRNDYFVLRGLATLGKTELVIFDRRGAQVYRNLNYDNSWNGVDYNKNPLPEDTYFFVLKTANGKSISGYIVIRR